MQTVPENSAQRTDDGKANVAPDGGTGNSSPPNGRVKKTPGRGELINLLKKARQTGASDLHISVGKAVFLRLNGAFKFAQLPLTSQNTQDLFFEILSEEQKQKLKEQLNLELCLVDEAGNRYRGCIIHHRLGWDGSFRMINDRIPSFEELSLPPSLASLTEYTQGLILVGGPAGSGKTTTLAALLNRINETRQDHIITIEDPIEYIIPPKQCQVTQREAGQHTASFAVALRAALREDPDIIMVGEMRDLETISMVITAAETGHLVFSTIHTTSASRTIGAVINAFPPEQQTQIRVMISESLRGIICQQLVPSKDGTRRHLALEILISNPGIANIIRDNKMELLPSEIQTGAKLGMQLMDDSLFKLLKEGKITKQQAYNRVRNRKIFSKRM